MTPWPADSEDFGERGGRAAPPRPSEYSGGGAYTQHGRYPSNEEVFPQRQYPLMGQNPPSNWLPNPQQQPFGDRRGSLGSLPPPTTNIPYELAMIQAQRQAMEAEQLDLRRMSQALGSTRRRSSIREAASTFGSLEPYIHTSLVASERLKKKRRVSVPTMILSNKRGNSFPMPSLEEGYKCRIEPMETFQRAWEMHVTRSKQMFSDDTEKQNTYVKWRFTSALRGGRISFSAEDIGKSDS